MADADVLRILKSRTLPNVPPTVIAPVRLLACVERSTSVVPLLAVSVNAPALAACVMVPVCVIPAPAVIFRVPVPTLDVPNTNALVSRKLTLLAPLLLRPTAPVKLLLALVKVIPAAPVVKLLVPVTVKEPLHNSLKVMAVKA